MEALPIDGMFKKIGMLMMSKIGGSSGVLYGGAYMAAGKTLEGKQSLTSEDLCLALEAMVNDMIQRKAFEHRALWMALLIDKGRKQGLDDSFAHNAILRCGMFHGEVKFPRTDDLTEFAPVFASPDVVNTFEMGILESSDKKLSIDFHYCPLVATWQKLDLPEEDMPALCDIAMDGDRGIISTYPKFSFELGETIAKGNDMCQICITKED